MTAALPPRRLRWGWEQGSPLPPGGRGRRRGGGCPAACAAAPGARFPRGRGAQRRGWGAAAWGCAHRRPRSRRGKKHTPAVFDLIIYAFNGRSSSSKEGERVRNVFFFFFSGGRVVFNIWHSVISTRRLLKHLLSPNACGSARGHGDKAKGQLGHSGFRGLGAPDGRPGCPPAGRVSRERMNGGN